MLLEVKNQPGKFWEEVSRLFKLRISPYVLADYPRSFRLLLDFADRANSRLPVDAGTWAEALYTQLKNHMLDSNPRVIYWEGKEPALVTKKFTPPRAELLDQVKEAELREQEAAQHQALVKRREEQERWRKECPKVIAQFQPVKNGRVDHATLQRVTQALQTYLDKYEVQHQLDLQAYEDDKTFNEWSVNWEGVCARMEEFANKAYDAAEGRTAISERR